MFNEKQLEAINSLEGRIRVIASAGSGKTGCLTHRYAKLVKSGINPKNILCVTFTNKAAKEMKDRIIKLTGSGDYSLINTFHGFCVRVLKESISLLGYPNNFSILDSDDQTSILKKVYKENKIDFEEISYTMAKDIIANRKSSKEDGLIELLKRDKTIQKSYTNAKKEFKQNDIIDYTELVEDVIYWGYLYHQQRCLGLDFDDLIIMTVILFKEHPKILKKWQNKLKYVMVDEFQDASQRQYDLVTMLSAKHGNLFVVGDPDQTIYTWRGARPEILVDFDKDAPTKTIIMNQNYRSTPNILNVANTLIEKNTLRIEKELFTENPEGKDVWFRHFNDFKDEAAWIIRSIKKALETYKPYEIAVLYRMHFLSRKVEEELVRNRIPYIIHSGTNFYERTEVKDIIAYLKVIQNPNDDLSLERIINKPTRGIGNKKLIELRELADKNDTSLWGACNIINNDKVHSFVDLISYLRNAQHNNLVDLVKDIIKKSNYKKLIEKSLEPERVENIKELIKAISEFEGSLDDYLQEISLLTNIDRKDNKSCITLMTVHSSKGLEFPVVYVIGMSNGFFPSGKAETEEEKEEERRLVYVACTRAKERLILTDSAGKDFNGQEKETSIFIRDIINDIDSNINLNSQEICSAAYKPSCDIIQYKDNTTMINNYGNKSHGQYFDSNGNYYDWDDDTYLQGSISFDDIFDESDLC